MARAVLFQAAHRCLFWVCHKTWGSLDFNDFLPQNGACEGFGRGHSGHLILGNIITKENINTHTDVKQGSMYSQTKKNTPLFRANHSKLKKKVGYVIYLCSIWIV